jgi:hypothetical protein
MAVIIPYRQSSSGPAKAFNREARKETAKVAKTSQSSRRKAGCHFGPPGGVCDFFARFAVKVFPVSDIFGLQPLIFVVVISRLGKGRKERHSWPEKASIKSSSLEIWAKIRK